MAAIVVTLTQLKSRMSQQAYRTAFFVNQTAVDGEAYAQRCLDQAIDEAEALLRARGAFTADLPAPVAEHIITQDIVVALAYARAMQFNPTAAGEKSPATEFRKRATDLADQVLADRIRLGNSDVRPNPILSFTGTTNELGLSTRPFANSADGINNGGY